VTAKAKPELSAKCLLAAVVSRHLCLIFIFRTFTVANLLLASANFASYSHQVVF